MRRILQLGSPVLRTPPKPVEEFDGRLQAEVHQMQKAMRNARGVGLAANQIGFFRRVFVWAAEGREGVVCNPKLVYYTDDELADEEGCLSVFYGRLFSPSVWRRRAVRIEGFTQTGEPLELEAEGLIARIFQHEIDHLDGKLFIDRLRGQERARFNEQLRDRNIAEARA